MNIAAQDMRSAASIAAYIRHAVSSMLHPPYCIKHQAEASLVITLMRCAQLRNRSTIERTEVSHDSCIGLHDSQK